MNKRVEKPKIFKVGQLLYGVDLTAPEYDKVIGMVNRGHDSWEVYHQQEIARLEAKYNKLSNLRDDEMARHISEIARLEKDAKNDEMHRKTQRQHIERLEKENARIKGISVRDIEDTIEIIHNKYRIPGLAKQIHNLIQGGGK